ncbi:MAG: S1/P1 nuclease [Rhodocyclales bacterium]|nr:S1/P1 nuclease [Rhodocyclales bacterium]
MPVRPDSSTRLLLAVMLVVLAALLARPALAWSKAGHRVMARIAFHDLQASAPAVTKAIEQIMSAHPAADAFADRLREEGGDPATRLARLFAEMAQWPDEVRKKPWQSYHHGSWHSADLPYHPPGDESMALPVRARNEDIVWAFRENLRIFIDPASSGAERSVALCWIFHLVGDGHQPLHAATLFNRMFPAGDRRGGRFWIRVQPSADPITLHRFWDGIVLRSDQASDVARLATRLMQEHPVASYPQLTRRPFLKPDAFEAWLVEESHVLAISGVYLQGRLEGSPVADQAPVLTSRYVLNAERVGARQLALSGYRLAEILRLVVPQIVVPSDQRP